MSSEVRVNVILCKVRGMAGIHYIAIDTCINVHPSYMTPTSESGKALSISRSRRTLLPDHSIISKAISKLHYLSKGTDPGQLGFPAYMTNTAGNLAANSTFLENKLSDRTSGGRFTTAKYAKFREQTAISIWRVVLIVAGSTAFFILTIILIICGILSISSRVLQGNLTRQTGENNHKENENESSCLQTTLGTREYSDIDTFYEIPNIHTVTPENDTYPHGTYEMYNSETQSASSSELYSSEESRASPLDSCSIYSGDWIEIPRQTSPSL